MNGYNFTERVRKTLALAREEAVALHHEYVGTEHILLGILREGNGVAMTVMSNLSVDDDVLRGVVLRMTKAGDPSRPVGPDLPYASRAKHVLEKAMEEARTLNHSYVGTEHLLLGLLREGKGLGATALGEVGVTLDMARAETMSILGTDLPQPQSNAGAMKHLSGSGRRIREIIAAAYDIATRRGSTELSPAHLAMALLVHDGGFANAVLQRLGFDVDAALTQLDAYAPSTGTEVSADAIIRPTALTIQTMDAMEELGRQSRGSVAVTQHLLLALLRITNIEAVFAAQGAGLAEVTREIERMTG
jgi:ATP-dependent Clp protease ATP-binding subunit ClpA